MQPVQAIIIRKTVFFTSRKFNRHIYKDNIFLRSTSSLTSSIGIEARTGQLQEFSEFICTVPRLRVTLQKTFYHMKGIPYQKRNIRQCIRARSTQRVHKVSWLNRTGIHHAEKEPGRNMLFFNNVVISQLIL